MADPVFEPSAPSNEGLSLDTSSNATSVLQQAIYRNTEQAAIASDAKYAEMERKRLAEAARQSGYWAQGSINPDAVTNFAAASAVGTARWVDNLRALPFNTAGASQLAATSDEAKAAYSYSLATNELRKKRSNVYEQNLKGIISREEAKAQIDAIDEQEKSWVPPTEEAMAELNSPYVPATGTGMYGTNDATAPTYGNFKQPSQKEILDQAMGNLTKGFDLSNFYSNKVSGIYNPLERDALMGQISDAWKDTESIRDKIESDKKSGKFVSATYESGKLAANLIMNGVGAAIDNPNAVLDFVGENSTQLALGAINPALLVAGNLGYGMDIYNGSVLAYQADNEGRLPSNVESSEMLAWSLSASAAESIGDIAIIKSVMPSFMSKSVVGKVANTAKKVVPTVAKVVGKETLTEGYQTAVEENLSKLDRNFTSDDFESIYKASVIGGASGGVISGPGAVVQDVGSVSKAVGSKVESAAAAKEEATIAKDTLSDTYKSAVETGDFAEVSNKESKSYSAVSLAKSYQQRNAKADVTVEEKAANFSNVEDIYYDSADTVYEAQLAYNKLVDNKAPKEEAAKALNKLAVLSQEKNNLEQLYKATKQTVVTGNVSEDIAQVTAAKESTEATTDAASRIFGSRDLGLDRLDSKEATKLSENTSGSFTKDQVKKLKDYAVLTESIEAIPEKKSAAQVANDVINGGFDKKTNKEMVGLKQHMDRIKLYTSRGNTDQAKIQLETLDLFAGSQSNKLKNLNTVYDALKSQSAIPDNVRAELAAQGITRLDSFADNRKNLVSINALRNSVQKEVTALNIGLGQMQELVGVKPTPAAEAVVEATPVVAEEAVAVIAEEAPTVAPEPVVTAKAETVSPSTKTNFEVRLEELIELLPNNKTSIRMKKAIAKGTKIPAKNVKSAVKVLENNLNQEKALAEKAVVAETVVEPVVVAEPEAAVEEVVETVVAEEAVVEPTVTAEVTPKGSLGQRIVNNGLSTEEPFSRTKEWLMSVNWVSQFFSAKKVVDDVDGSTKGSALQDIPNLFAKLREEGFASVLPYFKDEVITERQEANLNNMLDVDSKFTAVLKELIKPRNKGFEYQDMFNFLLKDGELDPNTHSVLNTVAYNWIATQASETAYNDQSTVKGMLGYKEDDILPPGASETLANVGMFKVNLVKELGKEAYRMLGLSINADAPGNAQANLEISLGNVLVGMLSDSGFIQLTELESSVVSGFIKITLDMKSEKNIEQQLSNKTIQFYRVSVDQEYSKSQPQMLDSDVMNIVALSKDTDGMTQSLFGAKAYQTGPEFSVPEKTVNNMKGTAQKVGKRVKNILKKHQALKHFIKKDQNTVYNMIGSSNRRKLAGYVEDPESGAHDYNVEGVISKNKSIDKGISHWDDFTSRVANWNDGAGFNTPFYFKHEIWKQSRVGMVGNTVNPQNNKEHRHLVATEGSIHKVKFSSVKDVTQFNLAVASSFGIKIDNRSDETSLIELDEKLSNPIVQEGILAVIEVLFNSNKETEYTTDQSDRIMAAVSELDGNSYSLDGLINVSRKINAQRTGKAEFDSDISVEIDGVTNGPIIGMLQLTASSNMDNMKARLNKGGIYFKGNVTNFGDWVSDKVNNDSYQDLAVMWSDALDIIKRNPDSSAARSIEMMESPEFFGSLRDSNSVITKEGRKLAKDPLITLFYGSGDSLVLSNLEEVLVANIYKKVEELVSNNDKAGLAELSNKLNDLANRKDAIKFDLKGDIKNNLKVFLDPKAETAIRTIITGTYGESLLRAVDVTYGKFKENRKSINDSLSVVNQIFNIMYADKIKIRTAELMEDGKIVEGMATLPKDEINKIKEELIETMPIINNFFSKESGNINEGTFVGKTSDVSVLDKAHYQASVFSRNIKGENKKSVNTYSYEETYEDTGVRTAVTAIQSMDAATMLLFLERFEALGVHDAVIVNPSDAVELAGKMNEVFKEVMEGISIADEATNTLNRSVKLLLEYSKETGNAELVESIDNFIRMTNIRVNGNEVGTLKDFTNNTVKKLKEIDTMHKEVLSEVTSYDQYHYNGGEYNAATEEANSLDLSVEEFIRETQESQPEREFSSEEQLSSEYVETISSIYNNLPDSNEEVMDIVAGYIAEGLDLEQSIAESKNYFDGAVDESVFDQIESMLSSNPFGSNGAGIKQSDFINKAEIITSKNLVQVFDSMEASNFTPENAGHQNYLRTMLSTVVAKVMNEKTYNLYQTTSKNSETSGATNLTDVYIQHQIANENMNISSLLANGIRMSSQEVLAHEVVHNIVSSFIDTNSKAVNEINRVWRLVKNKITIEDFMADPELDKTDPTYEIEYAAAVARHDHMFTARTEKVKLPDGTTVERNNTHLHEFVAFGLTNERFRKILASDKVNENPLRKAWLGDLNLQDKIVAIFNALIEVIQLRIGNLKNLTKDKQLDALVRSMVGLEIRKKAGLIHFANVVLEKPTDGMKKVIDFASENLVKAAESDLAKNSKYKIVRIAGGITRIIATNAPSALMDATQQVSDNINGVKYGIVQQVIAESQGRTESTTGLHELNRKSNKLIDQERLHVTKIISGAIRKSYKVALSTVENIAVNAAVIKTDLSSVMSYYSMQDMAKLLNTDNVFLDSEIANANSALSNYGPNEHFYRRAARNLGFFMAKGIAIEEHTLLNAHNIAWLGGTDQTINMTLAEETSRIALIDRIATLYAMKHTSKSARKLSGVVLAREAESNSIENGFMATLSIHQEIKTEAKEKLFDGSEALFIKGYTKDTYNPNTALKVATLDQEAELVGLGYVRNLMPIPRDPSDPVRDDLYMYVSKDGAAIAQMSAGILSYTSSKSMGTDSVQIRDQLGDPDAGSAGAMDSAALLKSKSAAISEMFVDRDVQEKANQNFMIPIIAPNGEIAGYRYVMSENTKNTVLEKNNNFYEILGGMAGNIVDKVASKSINEDVIAELKNMYDTEYATKGSTFVEISPISSDPKLREIYSMLPDRTKKNVRDVWGSNTMLVRKDVVDLVFGQRKMTVSELFQMEADDRNALQEFTVNAAFKILGVKAPVRLRKTENVVKELVREIKDWVVVKGGVVTAANIMSNNVFLKMKGLSVVEIVKYQTEALNGGISYLKDKKELDELTIMLSIKLRNPQAYKVGDINRDKSRVAELKNNLIINPVHELFEAGVMQSIIEDIDDSGDDYTYKSSLAKYVSSKTEWVPGSVKSAAKIAYMSKDTKVYKLLSNGVRMSDFVSRYALHKHYTTRAVNPLSTGDSINKIVDAFINYDIPTSRLIQYGNDIGLIWFSKYFIRVQKVILDTFKENPSQVLMTLALQNVLGDVSDVTDSIIGLNKNPLSVVGDPISGLTAIGDILTVETAQKLL